MRLGVVAALVGIAVAGVLTAVNSHRPSAAEVARARVQYESDLDQCLAGKFVNERDLPPGTTLKQFCEQNVKLRYFLPGNEFELSELPDIVSGTSVLLILGALLIGASLVGAEWHAGTMTTLLTWEPRRLRVLAAKAISAAAVTFLVSIALLVVLSIVLWLVALTRGVSEGLGGGFLQTLAGGVLRASAAASAASLIGLSIAMLGRNTAAAVGVGFAYLGVIEGLIRGLRPAWQPWLLGDNVAVFVGGEPTQLGAEHGVLRTLTMAAVVVSVYAIALLTAAALAFRARDVS